MNRRNVVDRRDGSCALSRVQILEKLRLPRPPPPSLSHSPKCISGAFLRKQIVCALAYLDDPRSIEDRVPRRLIAFHVPQDAAYADVVRVDQTKGSDIDEIVLEVLEVEGLDILRIKKPASESSRSCCAFRCP